MSRCQTGRIVNVECLQQSLSLFLFFCGMLACRKRGLSKAWYHSAISALSSHEQEVWDWLNCFSFAKDELPVVCDKEGVSLCPFLLFSVASAQWIRSRIYGLIIQHCTKFRPHCTMLYCSLRRRSMWHCIDNHSTCLLKHGSSCPRGPLQQNGLVVGSVAEMCSSGCAYQFLGLFLLYGVLACWC